MLGGRLKWLSQPWYQCCGSGSVCFYASWILLSSSKRVRKTMIATIWWLLFDHQCQRHRWRTMGFISGCRYLKVNLKAKIYIYVNSTIQRRPNRIIQILKIFFICHRCRWHRWSALSCEYLREFLEKFGTVLMGYSWAGGETDSWKKPEVKNLVTLSL